MYRNTRLILLCFFVVATSAQATVDEFYTISFSQGRIEKDEGANLVTYVFTESSLSGEEEIPGEEARLAPKEMRITCSPTSNVIAVQKNDARLNDTFQNQKACQDTVDKIMKRKTSTRGENRFSFWALKVRFSPEKKDISFEY